MKEQQDKPNEATRLHNAYFYKIKPRSIERMAYNKILSKLAVARNDHSIEIWDFTSSPFLENVIPKAPGVTIEDIIWSGTRLFSVGLTGFLVEWDLKTLKVRNKLFTTGSAIWCLDKSPNGNQLAVGTEEGYITIFNITNNDMIYERLLDKQKERIICLKFDRTGEMVVAGSVGFIRIWNIESGRCISKMTIARMYRHQEAIVRTLEVLSDFTILSGDSRGYITVWDGHVGAQIESHQVLKADVLALAVNEEENLFMCSGVEPLIKIYSKTLIKREDSECFRWVKCLQRQVHNHDIKVLINIDDRILSGSADGFLGISSLSRGDSEIFKYGPFVKNPCVVTAPEKRLVLVRYPNHLEVWSPGTTIRSSLDSTDEEREGDNKVHEKENQADKLDRSNLPLGSLPKKILDLKSKNEDLIVSASISSNGKWICYSTLYETRLFHLNFAEDQKPRAQLKLVKKLPEELKDVLEMHFSPDSQRLFILQTDTYDILIFDLESSHSSGEVTFIERISTTKHLKEQVSFFSVSPCSLYIGAASLDHRIGIWHASQGKTFEHLANLPRYNAPPTALAFHPKQPLIVAAYSDSRIIEYNLEEKRFTCSELNYFVENAKSHCVRNILLDSRNPDVIVLQNDSYMFALEKVLIEKSQENDVEPPERKVTRRSIASISSQESNPEDSKKLYSLEFKMEKSYEHLLHLSSLGNNEIFALVVNLESLLKEMPPVLKQKKFGAA